MRWAQHGEPIDLAAIDQLAHDQPSLDRLADADVVRNQQPHDGKPQRHQQWHQLVGTRLEAEACCRSERPGATPQRQPQRLGEEAGAFLGCGLRGARQLEARRSHRLALQCGMNELHVRLGPGERAQAQRLGIRGGQRHPFPPARVDEIAGREGGDAHALAPSSSTSSRGG